MLPESGHSAPVWVSRYTSSSNSQDIAENIVLGRDGSVYVGGFSHVGGPTKAAIVKYSNSGEQLWAVENTNISRVDLVGPLPLTALDPGDGLRFAGNWAAATNEVFVVSYSSTGTLLWERRFREGSETHPFSLDTDVFSNTVVVGWSQTSNGWNAILLKYAPDGSLLWNRSYPLSAVYVSVTTLANGDILAGAGSNFGGARILKHSAAGELLWTAELGHGIPWQIKVDAGGNIFIANRGIASESVFIKLNASGELLWRKPAGPMVIAHMTLDAAGDLFATGSGFFVVKLDTNGNELWRSRFAQAGAFIDNPQGIAVHGSGVSVGFPLYDTAVSVQRFSAAHYDAAGVEVWRASYTNVGGSVHGMVGDANQGIYLTGMGDPFPGDFQTLKFDVALNPLRPTILSPPHNLEVLAGTNFASFSVTTANGPNTFQWRLDGLAIPDATNSTLILTQLNIDHAGGYSVIVSNSHGYVITPEAQLAVRMPPNVYWDGFAPTNQTLITGNELLLRAYTSGDGPLTFEWRRNGTLLPQTNSTLTIETVTTAEAGLYTVVARSPFGSDTNFPIAISVVPRTALDEWRWVRPRPQGNTLSAVAFGNGRFVAVGYLGALLISTNGLGWTVTNLHNADLSGIAFGNGTFVSVSFQGGFYSSTDGAVWVQRRPPSPSDDLIWGVFFLQDRFVACGYRVYSSVDGIVWTNHGEAPVTGEAIAAGAGRYVMTGLYTMISTNLSDWRMYYPDRGAPMRGIAYGNGVFVMNNWQQLYASQNGTEITHRYSVPHTVNVAFLNDRFFAVGRTIETSTDGASWTRVADSFSNPLWSITHGNGMYVAVGYNGAMATSPDGQTWTRAPRGLADLRGIAYGNGRYVVVGEEEAWTSTDGEAWASISGPAAEEPAAITWANGTFVVVGGDGELLTSKDGTSWTRVPLATNDLTAVIHDGTRFVVAGEGTVVLSTNGSEWTQIPVPQLQFPHAFAFGDGIYLVSNHSAFNALQISTNAVDWEFVFNSPSVASLAYGNGKFVGTMLGSAAVSGDGLTWTTYQGPPGLTFDSVIFANGLFVASGEYDAAIATSPDGRDWTVHPMRTQPSSGTVSSANGILWMLGEDEGIIRSARIQPAIRTRKAGAGLELTVQAYPGQSYRLQRATALGTWSDFQTFTPQTETTTFIDNATSPSLFYRILSP